MAKTKSTQVNSTSAFRRLIHSKSELRTGINDSRQYLDPGSAPTVIRELCKVPVYSRLIALEAFPKEISRIKFGRPLMPVSADLDTIWNASVISLYAKELNEFIGQRTRFENAYLNGSLDEAIEALDNIESRFGMSVWLIDSRFRSLQLRDGLSAHKAYLEKVLNTDGIDAYVAAQLFYLSFSAQDNVSLADIANELEPVSGGDHLRELKDSFRSRINPFDLSDISDPWKCISFNENSPIIDRFQAFVTMTQLQLTRDKTATPYIAKAIDILKTIDEPRLNTLRTLISGRNALSSNDSETYLDVFDKYTIGDYSTCANQLEDLLTNSPRGGELYELAARTHAHLGNDLSDRPKTISNNIIDLIKSLFLLTGDVTSTRFQLQKMAIVVREMPPMNHIMAILAHSHARMTDSEYFEIDKIAAMSGTLTNPWNQELIRLLGFEPETLLPSDQKTSAAFDLHRLIQSSMILDKSLEAIAELPIPKERICRYSGHTCMRHAEFGRAAAFYREALCVSDDIQFLGNIGSLCTAHLRSGQIAKCLTLVADAYLKATNSYHLFPLETLLLSARNVTDESDIDWANHAIVAYIYSRHIGTQFDGDLSDAYEFSLERLDCARPSEIKIGDCGIPPQRLVFFLRYICTIRTLEDSIAFHSVEDIELERIRILQMLIDIDPDNSATYADEITSITKDMEVSRLFQSFETSRIYADEQGIVRSIESNVRDSLARYTRLLGDPDLEYQASDIARRIKELLDKSDKDSQVRNLHLPSTEREALFRSMHATLLDAFVLNPDYGLKTYLSTNILHGALEGELRSSLSRQGLLFSLDHVEREVHDYWDTTLGTLNDSEWSAIVAALGRFSDRVAQQIGRLRTEVIRVRLIDSPTGSFDFTMKDEEMTALMKEVLPSTTFEQFTNIMFKKFWSQVDDSLEAVRNELLNNFSHLVMVAFTTLATSLEQIASRPAMSPLIDAVAHARTEFGLDVNRVVGWFSRRKIKANAPFALATAAAVALKVTNNCFPRTPISPKTDIEISSMLRGDLLDAFVYIVDNCLQNALKRSGLKDKAPAINIYATAVDNHLLLEVENELAKSTDLAALRERVGEFLKAAEASKDPSIVTSEGGTGLRKIFRSLRADLNVTPNVSCSVTNDFKFRIGLTIPLMEVAVADLPN